MTTKKTAKKTKTSRPRGKRGRPTVKRVPPRTKLRKLLDAYCEKRKITLAEFAERRGIERTYLYAILSGAKTPSDGFVKRMAHGKSPSYRALSRAL
jgi:hypothetical protein